MSNERYLQVSYFVVLVCSLILGWLTYLALRRSLRAACDDAARSFLAPAVRRLLLLGFLSPPLLGFCSVSYFTCEKKTYADIIADRAHLVQINQTQLQAALHYSIVGIMVWCLMVFALLLTSRK